MIPPYLPSHGRDYTEQYIKNLSKRFEDFIENEKVNLIKNDDINNSQSKSEESASIDDGNSWIDGF